MTKTRHVAIVGQAKTGTTAAWYAIKHALDERGTEYFGLFERHKPAIFPSITNEGTPVVAKFVVTKEDFDKDVLRYFDTWIVMVRHPLDRLVSRLHFYGVFAANEGVPRHDLVRFADVVAAPRTSPGARSFSELDDLGAALAQRGLDPQRDERDSGLIIELADDPRSVELRYEDLVDNNLSGLSKVFDYDIEWVPPESAKSFVFRSRSAGQWRGWLLEEELDLVAVQTAPYLRRFGYEPVSAADLTLDADTEAARRYLIETYDRRVAQKEAASVKNRSDPRWLASVQERASLGQPKAAFQYARHVLATDPSDPGALKLMRLAAASGYRRAVEYVESSEASRHLRREV